MDFSKRLGCRACGIVTTERVSISIPYEVRPLGLLDVLDIVPTQWSGSKVEPSSGAAVRPEGHR